MQLMLTHGSPADPLEPLTHDMSNEAIVHLLGEDPPHLVLCGGSHVPFDRIVDRGSVEEGQARHVRVINLGSVGEAPTLQERYAHATFIEVDGAEITVEQMSVPLGRAA